MDSLNVNVTNNLLKTENKDWLKDKSNKNLFSDNNRFVDMVVILNDDTYADYFDEEGNLKESVVENTVFMTGNLTNKDLFIDMGNLSFIGLDDSIQSDLTITLGDDEDNYSNIAVSNLNIINNNKITAIKVMNNASDVLIDNNLIFINTTTS